MFPLTPDRLADLGDARDAVEAPPVDPGDVAADPDPDADAEPDPRPRSTIHPTGDRRSTRARRYQGSR